MSTFEKGEEAQVSSVFQFSLAGLIILSLTLIGASSFIAYELTEVTKPRMADAFVTKPNDKTQSIHTGPWGTLLTRNMDLERPAGIPHGKRFSSAAGSLDL